jgi:hypothetical protein
MCFYHLVLKCGEPTPLCVLLLMTSAMREYIGPLHHKVRDWA